MKPETFLTSHSLFTRAELASVLCVHGRVEATVDSHLARWARQGRIAPVKKGVFIRLDTPQGPHERSPDFVVLASRMAPDAAIAYHTALEAHGTSPLTMTMSSQIGVGFAVSTICPPRFSISPRSSILGKRSIPPSLRVT